MLIAIDFAPLERILALLRRSNMLIAIDFAPLERIPGFAPEEQHVYSYSLERHPRSGGAPCLSLNV